MAHTDLYAEALAVYDRPRRGAVAAGVIQDGVVLFRGEVGLANIELSVKADAGTRFQIASLTKQFLAVLAVRLAEDGVIDLDEDARGRHPALTGQQAAITIRQLLSHTSGLLDTFDLLTMAGADIETPITDSTVADLMVRQRHLNFEPGTGFSYCNSGFEITAAIIESAQKTPVAALLRQLVFEPLGMRDTLLVNRDSTLVEREASGYLVHADRVRRGRHGVPFNGGAGMQTTLDDFLRWEGYLLGPGRSLLAALETVPTFPNGARSLYGLGTYVDAWRGLSISGHGGLLPGFVSSNVRSAAHATSAVVMSNSSDVPADSLSRRLLEIALGDRAGAMPQFSSRVEPGRYYEETGNELVDVSREDGRLWARAHGWRIGLSSQADGSVTFEDPILDRLLVAGEPPLMVEWGRHKPLRRIAATPPTGGLSSFKGSYARAEIPTVFQLTVKDDGLVLGIRGALGSTDYTLERIDERLFVGRSPPGHWMPMDLLIRFEGHGPAPAMTLTTGRTKALVLQRLAANGPASLAERPGTPS